MSPRAACRLEALGFARVYDYVDGISDWLAAGLPVEGDEQQPLRVADALRTDIPTCRLATPVEEIRRLLATTGWEIGVVVDCGDVVVGRVRASALDGQSDATAQQVMEPGPGTVRPDGPLEPLLDRLHERDIAEALVSTPQGELLGAVVRDEAQRLLAGGAPERIWRDCDCCPGRWTTAG